MVNGYLTSGDIAPQIIFANGPAATAYSTARDALYGWSATPTFQIDGVSQQLGWSQANVQNYINARLAVPSYVSIDANVVGNASGGNVYYTITIEQDPGVSGAVKVWSAVLESHDIATSSYGVYAGQELMWEPRAFPLGTSGTAITISSPFPQTINLMGTYTLNPAAHTFTNLDLITYVQASTGTHEVLNAAIADMPDSATGIGGPDGEEIGSEASLFVWPNPSFGELSIGALLPSGATGTVTVFDLAGRSVASFEASGATGIEIGAPGVYIARLETSSGEILASRFTVIR
jgi:hypothetical protein